MLVLGALVLLDGDDARAIPRDGNGARPTIAPARGGELVAARRRRYARPKKKAKAKAASPAPAETPPETPPPAAGPAAASPDPGNLQRGGRVEFDGRLVQGQTAKSGAIYLFARQRTDLRSMVRERESYRKEILRTVFTDPGK
jgi:hypothetical protein